MKLRAIGTGSRYCSHPLTPPAWLFVSDQDLILFGVPWSITTALKRYSYDVTNLKVISALSPNMEEIGGIAEIAYLARTKKFRPSFVAPTTVIAATRNIVESTIGCPLEEVFNVRSAIKITTQEEYFTEVFRFIPCLNSPYFSLMCQNSGVFISGNSDVSEEFLVSTNASLILQNVGSPASHTSVPSLEKLSELPTYLQSKMWLYGYDNESKSLEQPFPMMYVTPGAWVFDSGRRDKILSKERFIRENSKKQI